MPININESVIEFKPLFYKESKCTEEYDDEICENCKFFKFETVSHPGGHYSATTESYFCDLGYWCDDF